ncbi:MAG: hypothetical protein L0387_44390 [Acidobacteria bacterium]|nr:hypothetical protein [Acidobacteriota bacterium]
MPSVLESQIQAAEQEWLENWKRGPTRLRWSKVPLQVGDSAPDFELQDSCLAYRYQYCDNYPDPALLVTAIQEAAA